MTNMDEIRKEIAIRHEVLIGKDDPILMIVTVFDKAIEQLIGEHAAALNAQQDEILKKVLVALKQGETDARATGSRVITQVAEYGSNQIKEAIAEASAPVIKELRETRVDILKIRREAIQAKKVAIYAAGVACLFAVLNLGLLWSNFGA